MLIAKTQQESDLFCEQEQSHIFRLEQKPITVVFNGHTCLVDNQNQKLVYFPERKFQSTVKTKKYGVLAFMESIKNLLDSKYNKAILAVYCGERSYKKLKKTTNLVVGLSTYEETYFFEDKEFSNSGGVYLNHVERIEPMNAYLIIVERNKFSNNGVTIIDNFQIKIKTKENGL